MTSPNNARRTRVRRALFVVLLLGASAAIAGPADRSTLPDLRAMAATGAVNLALSRMDAVQPAAAIDPKEWARFERARIDILTTADAPERALDRLRRIPEAAPATFRRWARERRAVLHLELGDAGPARRLLRALLWQHGATAEPADRKRWRRLVIRAYLVGGHIDDAVTALRRFDQDYRNDSDAWRVLRTRVLLRAGHATAAATRLPPAKQRDNELKILGMLARLRAGRLPPVEAYDRSLKAANADATGPAAAARWSFIAAAAAERAQALGRRALAIERALAYAEALPATDHLFVLDGDDLWAAWLAFGRQAGNTKRLLIGDDDAWFAAVEEALPMAPVRARSLLAVVAREGSPSARGRAHRRLLTELEQSFDGGLGLAIVRQAYLNAPQHYPTLATVPAGIRYRLVDDALAGNDLELASRLLTGLSAAPPGVEPFAWSLVRARVLVRAGHHAQGAIALGDIISAHPELGGKQLDRLLQVVFDLQGAGEHARALALLERLAARDWPFQRQRELRYWRAQSHAGLEQYRRAAALYLRSALAGGLGGDPWGQTARFHAAEMLAKAGLAADARRVYQGLLRATGNENRRAILLHRLRRLPPPASEATE